MSVTRNLEEGFLIGKIQICTWKRVFYIPWQLEHQNFAAQCKLNHRNLFFEVIVLADVLEVEAEEFVLLLFKQATELADGLLDHLHVVRVRDVEHRAPMRGWGKLLREENDVFHGAVDWMSNVDKPPQRNRGRGERNEAEEEGTRSWGGRDKKGTVQIIRIVADSGPKWTPES